MSVLLVLISRRVLESGERDRPLLHLAHRILTRRGTRHTGADLSGANFTGTVLAQADVSNAVMPGATWDIGEGPVTFVDAEP
jgi:hypothetical protein